MKQLRRLFLFCCLLSLFPRQTSTAAGETVLIYAVYYDTKISNEVDEAIALLNIHPTAVNLKGWQISDDEKTATIDTDFLLQPNEIAWLTEGASKFQAEFGFAPTFEYRDDDDATIPNLSGGAPSLTNNGDEVILLRPDLTVADAVLYENGNPADVPTGEWTGAGVFPYVVSRQISANGQIIFRRHVNGNFPDTNTATDWANSYPDPSAGRRALYPGWLETQPTYFSSGAYQQSTYTDAAPYIQVLVAPDNFYAGLLAHIQQAQHSIQVTGLTFEHPQLAMALAERIKAGVAVTVLLEGSPPGGTSEMQDWVCRHLATGQNGRELPADTLDYTGQCWLMKSDYQGSGSSASPRYKNYHAKYMLIDAGQATQKVVISTENWDTYSMPEDPKANGTKGNRGYALVTTNVAVIRHIQQLWQADFQPCTALNASGYCLSGYYDLTPWAAPDDVPPWPYLALDNTAYQASFPQPFVMPQAPATFTVLHAPEQTLGQANGILSLIERANTPGGKLYVQQLYERTYWGTSADSVTSDPNPRLAGYIEAARQGADVRILLNELLLDINGELRTVEPTPTDNNATCAYLHAIAMAENLTLQCKVKRVTADDIHAKVILSWDGAMGYVHLGSINGSEASHKLNRELAIQVSAVDLYKYMETVFLTDWAH